MIDKNNNSRFHFSADDDEPEAIHQEELRELKIEKLGHRVTLLTILIPCMIGIILVIAYLDIKDRVTQSYDTGAIGVQKLSKDLSSKFSSLSLEQAKIKDIQAQKLPDLEKSAAFLQSRLTKLQKKVAQITDSTVKRDEVTRVTESMNEKVTEIREGLIPDFEALERVDKQILEDAGRMSEEITALSGNMTELKAGIDALGKEIESLSEKVIDKDKLELALKFREIEYRQSLLDKTTLLQKEIQAIRKEVKDLRENTASPTGAAPATPPSPPAAQTSSEDKPAETLEPKPTADESGGMVEQTIQQ